MKNSWFIPKTCLFSALAVALAINGCSRKSSDEYLALAEEFRDNGNTSKAVIELKNAVKLSPNDGVVRSLLGQTYIDRGQFLLAEKELEKALDLGIQDPHVYAQLMKARYYTYSFVEVLKLAGRYNDTVALSEQASLFKYLSSLKIENSEPPVPDTLSGDYRLIAQSAKYYSQAAFDLAWEQTKGFSDNLIEPLEKYLLIGAIALQTGKNEEAVEAFTNVEKIAPTLMPPKLQLAEAMLRAGDLENAEGKIDELLKLYNNSPYVNYLKSSLLMKRKNYVKSLEYAEKAIHGGMPEFTSLQVIAGISAYQVGNYEQAYFYLQKAEPKLLTESIARRVLAQTQLQLGYADEAANEIKKWNSSTEQDSTIFGNVISSLVDDGKLSEAKELTIQLNQSQDVTALGQLKEGMLRIATNDKSGLVNIESALSKDSSLEQAWVLLAQSHLQNGNKEDALRVASEWKKTDLDNGEVLEALIYSQSGEEERVLTILKSVLERSPNNLGASQLLLNQLVARKKFEDAYKVAHDILDANPGSQRALFHLANMGVVKSLHNQIELLLKERVEKGESDETSVLALTHFYFVSGNLEEVAETFSRYKNKLELNGLLRWGDTLLKGGKLNEARNIYTEANDKYPNQEVTWLRLIGINEITGDLDNAFALTEKAYKIFPQSRSMRLLLVNYSTQRGQLGKAHNLLDSLEKESVSSPLLLRFEGELAFANKEYRNATQLLEKYYLESPSFESSVLFAKALSLTGQGLKGAQVMEGEIEKLQNKVKARHTLAEYYVYLNEFQKAKDTYHEAIAENTSDFAAANNLADLYIMEGKIDEAIEFAEQAYLHSPNIPQVIETYGNALLLAGQADKSIRVLSEGLNKRPTDALIALRLVEAKIKVGKKQEAKRILGSIKVKNDNVKVRILELSKLIES